MDRWYYYYYYAKHIIHESYHIISMIAYDIYESYHINSIKSCNIYESYHFISRTKGHIQDDRADYDYDYDYNDRADGCMSLHFMTAGQSMLQQIYIYIYV